MGEITKSSVDLTDPDAFTAFMESTPQQTRPAEPASPEEATMSVSDFKADPRMQKNFEILTEGLLNEDWVSSTLGTSMFTGGSGPSLGEGLAFKSGLLDPSDLIIDRLRRDGWTTMGSFGTARMLENATPEVKQAYREIKEAWDKTDPEGFFENIAAFTDNALNLASDPLNYLTLGLGGAAVKLTSKQAAKLERGMLKSALNFVGSNTSNSIALKSAAAGAGWGGLAELGDQSVNMAADIQKELDAGRLGVATGVGFGGGALIGKGIGKFVESQMANKNLTTAVDEGEVENRVVNDTGQPVQDEITLEDAQAAKLEFSDDVEQLILDVTPDEETAKRQQQFNAKKARQSTKQANLEARDERLWGGFIPDSKVDEILEQYDIDRLDFEEYMLDYEANRDLPNIDDPDDYLMEEMGEVFYDLNKAKQSREFAFAAFQNYKNRGQRYGAVSAKLDEALDDLADASVDPVEELAPEVSSKAQAFSAKVGGGEQTTEEVGDIITQVQAGEMSPDNARAALYKITQSFHGKVALGRPTKVLVKFKGQSSTAERLAETIRHDANETFTSETRQVGMDFNETWKDYAGELYSELVESLNAVRNISVRGFKDVSNTELLRVLRGGTSQSEDITKAAAAIRRNVLDKVILKNKEEGLISGDEITPDYFPRLWNRKALMKDFYGTSRPMTQRSKVARAGKGENKFAKLLIEDGEAADMEEANAIILGMLKKNTDDQGPSGSEFVSGNSFFTARKFSKITDDNKYEEFLDNDVENVLFQYITQSANAYTKRKVLGVNSLEEFQTKWIDPIKQEVEATGNVFDNTDAEDIRNLYRSITGEDIQDFGEGAQLIRDTYVTAVRMSTLPLATISSLTEVLLNVQKAGVGATIKGFGQALGQGAELLTTKMRRALGAQGLSDPEIIKEMRESFMFLENAAVSSADRLGDSSLSGHAFKKINRAFFKVTFLDQWTKLVQLTSYNIGKSEIHKNLKAIAAHGTLPDSKRIKRMRQQLAELNIDVDQGVAYLNRNEGEINFKDPFYKNVKRGAARFAGQVVLDTNPRAAIKSAWMSNPKRAFAAELLGYPAAFSNVVLKDFARKLTNFSDNPVGAANTIAAGLSMTAAATGLNYVRNPDSISDKSGAQLAAEGVARWGGNGVLVDLAQRAAKTYEMTDNPLYAGASLAGPLGSDIARGMAYGKIAPIIGGRMPFYGAIGPIAGKEAKRQYDKFWADLEKKKRRAPFEKGGIVDVEGASQEPDERIDKMTGRPYDSQAGEAYIDEEDRTERKRFVKGGITRAITDFVVDATNTILDTTKSNNIKVSQQGAEKVAINIEDAFKSKDVDVPSDLEDPDVREYILTGLKSHIDEKHDLSMDDIRETMPEFIDNEGQLIMGQKFSEARGYTPEQINAFNRNSELGEKIGSDAQDIDYFIQHELDTIGARTTGTQWIDKFNNFMEQSNEFQLQPEEITKLVDSFNEEEKRLVRKIFVNAPTKTKEVDYSIPQAERQANKEKYIADSQEKRVMYRAVSSGFNNEFEEAVAMPRELGLHMGTKEQAERMALYRRRGDIDEPDLPSAKQISARLRQPPKKATPPIAIMRGYIQVKNPLVIDSPGFSEGSSGMFVLDHPDIEPELIEKVLTEAPTQNIAKYRNGRKNIRQKIDDFYAWEDSEYLETKGTPKAELIRELKKTEINLLVRKLIEDQGFDSIKYFNPTDTPKGSDDLYSYVLFKPNQFKVEGAIEFDPQDPRHGFIGGGKVLRALQAKGAAA